MSTFIVRNDGALLEGIVTHAWRDPDTVSGPSTREWHIMVQLASGDPHLSTAAGATNIFDMIECRVTPVRPFCDEPWASRVFDEILGEKVQLFGSWGDLTGEGGRTQTVVWPIGWLKTETLTPIIEEHGFTQVVRDVNLFAFSDDSTVTLLGHEPPHHLEDRHFVIPIRFPHKPQSEAQPVFTVCTDHDDAERMIYFGRTVTQPRFPIKQVRGCGAVLSSLGGTDLLTVTVDAGSPSANQGFLFQKLALTYDEPFEKMCLPNVCLNEPGKNCQATGEYRYTWAWPRLDSVQAGDLLLGPAGGSGVIGLLLGALTGPQFYDHMAIFVENDGQTIRHCTAADDRVQEPRYFTASVKVTTPFGDLDERLPLAGIRQDVIKYGWPGSITQSLGEVFSTGRNHANPQFGFATLYPKVILAEAATPPPPHCCGSSIRVSAQNARHFMIQKPFRALWPRMTRVNGPTTRRCACNASPLGG